MSGKRGIGIFPSIIVALLIGLDTQLSACAALAPYPVKDSGLLAEDADIVWLDNQRVLFHGYKAVEFSTIPGKPHHLVGRGLYLWDTATGTIELFDTLVNRLDGRQGRSTLCVHDGVLTYVSQGLVITEERGQETKMPFPIQPYWYNPLSCRYYDTKPLWIVEGHRTIPLLEEHGYLDLGMRPEPDYLTLRLEQPNPAISFYAVQSKKSVPLPIGWLEARMSQITYVPYKNAYLISGLQYFDSEKGLSQPAWPDDVPFRVWWFSPDGTMKKEEVPNLPWMHGSYMSFLPVRIGLFIIKHSTAGPDRPGTIGGYLAQGQEVKKVIAGLLHKAAISLDGCRVAVVNDTYAMKPTSERMRLQIIQLCPGE